MPVQPNDIAYAGELPKRQGGLQGTPGNSFHPQGQPISYPLPTPVPKGYTLLMAPYDQDHTGPESSSHHIDCYSSNSDWTVGTQLCAPVSVVLRLSPQR